MTKQEKQKINKETLNDVLILLEQIKNKLDELYPYADDDKVKASHMDRLPDRIKDLEFWVYASGGPSK